MDEPTVTLREHIQAICSVRMEALEQRVDETRLDQRDAVTREDLARIVMETVRREQANMEGRAWALAIAIPLLVSALVSVAVKIL